MRWYSWDTVPPLADSSPRTVWQTAEFRHSRTMAQACPKLGLLGRARSPGLPRGERGPRCAWEDACQVAEATTTGSSVLHMGHPHNKHPFLSRRSPCRGDYTPALERCQEVDCLTGLRLAGRDRHGCFGVWQPCCRFLPSKACFDGSDGTDAHGAPEDRASCLRASRSPCEGRGIGPKHGFGLGKSASMACALQTAAGLWNQECSGFVCMSGGGDVY